MLRSTKLDKFLTISLISMIFFMSCYMLANGIYNIIFVILNYNNTECLNSEFYILISIISISNIFLSIYVFFQLREIVNLTKDLVCDRNYDKVKSICIIQVLTSSVLLIIFISIQQNIKNYSCHNFWFSIINNIFYTIFAITSLVGIIAMLFYLFVCCMYMCNCWGIADADIERGEIYGRGNSEYMHYFGQ